jgi:hypothetical protein
MNLWMDKETADALRTLGEHYGYASPTKIISYLIREAALKREVRSESTQL